ncbi:alpha/beta hydrolase [Agrococcus sp. 1P02AA]|uniref:alpha/beta hydrolase n=1 Tax=Agrococcus sp. 1P02AA TaxID=3132259 RepID=UPI0039A54BE5
MELDRVDPALRAAVQRPLGLPIDTRAGRLLGRLGPRLIRWPREPGVRIGRSRLGGVRVRTYAPATRRTEAVLLWIHGGGMVLGAPPMDDRFCSEIAAELGMRVASVDYRLAPDHPFPAPLDDCAAVHEALVERGCARIAIGGQSAGGGLAAALALRLRDAGGQRPIAQLLLCPMLDDRTAADRSLDAAEHFVWSNASNRIGWRALLGQEPGGATAPAHAVPARAADLSGLPSAWIGVGDIDLFHAEDLAYAERLRAAGVEVEVREVPGAPHGFESIAPSTEPAVRFRAAARAWLAEHAAP